MPTLSVAVSHTLGQEEAVQRLKDQFDVVKDKYGQQISDLQQQWNGNELGFRFAVLGIQVKGTVATDASEVKVAAELPYAAMLFKGTIEQQIRDELDKILAS